MKEIKRNDLGGFIGIFWIDADNERLFGVKTVPVNKGMTGPDGYRDSDITILDISHLIVWRDLLWTGRIPEHILQKESSGRYPIPTGRVFYIKAEDTFIVDIPSEFIPNEKIVERIKAQFNLNYENVKLESDFHNPLTFST